MKIVFMGTPDFATGILEAILLSGKHDIVAVVTAVDKPAGRGMQPMKSSVKHFAEKHQLPILQPEKLKDAVFIETLKKLQADIFVVVAFRMLPEDVWRIPSKGTFNLHASLLPQYRGAAPINWAIINGETQTGVTTFFINDKIDEGDIILTRTIDIAEEDNVGSLHDKLVEIGKKTVLETLEKIENKTVVETKQANFALLKTAPKIFKKDCKINWNQPTRSIHNFIRGLSPYPVAFTVFTHDNKQEGMIKIYKSRPEWEDHTQKAGLIETDNKTYVRIACPDGYIYVEEIQLVGKKRLPVKEFLLGNKNLHLTECH